MQMHVLHGSHFYHSSPSLNIAGTFQDRVLGNSNQKNLFNEAVQNSL
jgi:hypothetical protein